MPVRSPWPPLVFVLGKGGVGRSTVATALGAAWAQKGARVLVVQWAVADPISPWFGLPPTGHATHDLQPRLATLNFSLEETLREYFVDHLGLRLFHRLVVAGRHVRRLVRAAPGLAELMFLGRLYWLTTLAAAEGAPHFDRVIVDAPALGHGVSLLQAPDAARSLGMGGLLAEEIEHVAQLLGDSARSGVLMVTTAEELAVEETLELWPRVVLELGRAPLAVAINRAVAARLGDAPRDAVACRWLQPLADDAPDVPARVAIARVYEALTRRAARERALADRLAPRTPYGVVALDDGLLVDGEAKPRTVVTDVARALASLVEVSP